MHNNKQFFIISAAIGFAVFLTLLYLNIGILNLSGYFQKTDPYKDSIILFFHDECSYCTKVDTYIKDNKTDKKVDFVRLNILDNAYNSNELADKAQICGLDINEIGVPFLWDGVNKKCVIGYVDIIAFFRKAMLKKP